MKLKIQIVDKDGAVLSQAEGQDNISLVYKEMYKEGDEIHMESDVPCFVLARLEDSMEAVFGYLRGEYRLIVPFGEKKVCYSPKHFSGDMHLLSVRVATEDECVAYRNVAFNVLDSHDNSGFYPHTYANVETRGESVFAARNAIDGFYPNDDHGPWPYQSWGINRNPEAEMTIEFGRKVLVDKVVITLRADFPHDNWWKKAVIKFSDDSCEELSFIKTGMPQSFSITPRSVEWAKLCHMEKDETDPSPFPALTQIEVWGK